MKRLFNRLITLLTGPLDHLNPIDRFRTRLCASIILTLDLIFIVLFLMWFCLVTNKALIGMIIFPAGITLLTALLFYFYRFKNIQMVGNIFIFCIAMLIFSGVTWTGGLFSPAMNVLILVPILSILINDRKSGVIWFVLTLSAFGFQVVVKLLDVPIPNMMKPENLIYLETTLWMFTTGAIFAVLLGFESSNINLSKALFKDKEKFQYLSLHDSLTGLYNRHYFDRLLNKLIEFHDLTKKISL